jgi:predicted kinase
VASSGCWPVVVVHGPPGAGKSTLARELAARTGLPVFDRDEIKDAIFDSLGHSDRAWSMRVGDASWQLTWLLVERLLRSQVPFIVESNFRPGDSIVPRMREAAQTSGMTICSVHVTADDHVLWDRFEGRRKAGGRHPGHAGFELRDDFVAELRRRPHGSIDFGGDELIVDTTDRWPDIEQVATWLADRPSTQR